MGARASTTHHSRVPHCVALPRGGAMPKALVYPSVQRLVSVGRCERCALAHTDACPESSSAARNSGPMGLDNVDYQRQLQILAASLPLAWMSLRARRRTVARSAVARFSADMEVITCAHVHVQELTQLTCCPFTRSSINRVDRCTGSLASPLHALSPSSSSTFKSFANSTCTLQSLLTGISGGYACFFSRGCSKTIVGQRGSKKFEFTIDYIFYYILRGPTVALSTPGPAVVLVQNWGPTVVPKKTGTHCCP
jgi:hypothetical protein